MCDVLPPSLYTFVVYCLGKWTNNFTDYKCSVYFNSVLLGLFVGPLIRKYSYRKVAVVGSALSALGLIMTYPAESMAQILCTYSVMGGRYILRN
jgi:Na+/melibiose symporter-like transporter